MKDICDCGVPAVAQGYCLSCLRSFEINLSHETKLEEFERLATMPRTYDEIETEAAISESIPVQDQSNQIQPNKGGPKMTSTVTDTRIFPYNKEGSKLKAFASVQLNDDFWIKSIRLIDGKNGLFLAFPQSYKEEKNHDICFPSTADLRADITEAVIAKYEGEPVAEEQVEATA